MCPPGARDLRRLGEAMTAEVIAQAWTPACMADDEYAAWAEMNSRMTSRSERAKRPCADCTLGYASEMRAVGRCNGTPAGVEEEETMEQPPEVHLRPSRDVVPPTLRRVPVAVTPPPCASCVHEPVCALRQSVEGLADIPVAAPSVPDGLTITLVAAVECAHFLRDRAKPGPVRVLTPQERGQANSLGVGRRAPREISDEARQRMRDGAARAREAKAAKAVEAS